MKGAYRVFAYLIAAEVVIQAAAIALAVFGLSTWIEDGGTLNKAVMEGDDSSISGVIGFAIHGINGTMVIPILALLFLIISFFAKVPGGVKWAAIVFGLMVLQVALGIFAHEVYALGAASRHQRVRADGCRRVGRCPGQDGHPHGSCRPERIGLRSRR